MKEEGSGRRQGSGADGRTGGGARERVLGGGEGVWGIVVIYMHTMHACLTVQMLWQMHGRKLQAVHMLTVCVGMF